MEEEAVMVDAVVVDEVKVEDTMADQDHRITTRAMKSSSLHKHKARQ